MPPSERILLLLLGYVANQLTMLQKLLTFATNRTPTEEVEQHATGVQTQMLLRLIVGATNEGWELIRTRFIETSIAKDYLTRLDGQGQEALKQLKQQFGKSNILNKIRKHYAFHHPYNKDVEEAFVAAYDDCELDTYWNLYFSHHGFNSLFFISDLIFVHGIARHAGEVNLVEAQQKISKEASSASINLVEFAKAFFAAAWIKHFGQEIDATNIVTITDAPSVDEVWIPFFVEV
jgi:hypothetical protein